MRALNYFYDTAVTLTVTVVLIVGSSLVATVITDDPSAIAVYSPVAFTVTWEVSADTNVTSWAPPSGKTVAIIVAFPPTAIEVVALSTER